MPKTKIAYLQGGASGPYLAALIERLGHFTGNCSPKDPTADMDIGRRPRGPGEADIGYDRQISTLLATPASRL